MPVPPDSPRGLSRGGLWLVGLGCLALTLAIYFPALGLTFAGDDIEFVHPDPQWLKHAISPVETWHYYPLNRIVLYVLASVSGLQAGFIHGLSLLIHAGLGVGFAALLGRWGMDRRVCWIAPLFFVSRGVSYEAVTWVSTLSYLSVLAYALLSLGWWDRYLSGRGTRYLAFTVAGFTAALLTQENAVALVPVFFLFDLLMRRPMSLPLPRSRADLRVWRWSQHGVRLLKAGLRYAPLVLVVVAFLGLKSAQNRSVLMSGFTGSTTAAAAPVPSGEEVELRLPAERAWLGMLNRPGRAAQDFLLAATCLFMPSSTWYAEEESWLTRNVGWFLLPWLVLIGWVAWKGKPLTRFLLAWVMLYLVPLSVAGVPQARYYYLVTLPGAALIGLGWVTVWDRLAGSRRAALFGPVTAVLLALVIYGEGVFIRARLAEWRVASDMVRSVLSTLERDLDDGVSEVVLVNLPMRAESRYWPPQAFDNAEKHLTLMVRPPRPGVKVDAVYDRTFVDDRWPTVGRYASPSEVREKLGRPDVLGYQFLGRPPWITRLSSSGLRLF